MPTYEITAPDGRKFRVTGEGSQQDALAHIQSQFQEQAPQPVTRDQVQPGGDLATALLEPTMALGSSAIAAPVSGLAGLATAGGKAMGLTERDPADVVRSVQQAMTYQPRTKAGQAVTGAINLPFEKWAQGADYLGDKTAELSGSPALGAAVNTAVQAAPAILTRRGGKVAANVSRTPDPIRPVAAAREVAPVAEAAPGKRAAGLAEVSGAVPSLEELTSLRKDAYKRADDAGIVVRENSIKGLKTRVAAISKKEGLNSKLHPDAAASIDEILGSKGDLSLTEVETLRKIANDAKGSIKPADQRIASKVVDEIDDYIDNLSDSDVVTGDAAGSKALKEARGLYSREKKALEIDQLVKRAELSAPNFSGSGMENALRTEFRSLAKNARRLKRFTPEEQAAIKKVAMGGPVENTMRFIGKFAPTGVVSGVLSGGAGAMIAGPLGVALPATGLIGRSIATRMTKKNVAAAEELMRRGPKPSLQPKRNALAEPLEY